MQKKIAVLTACLAERPFSDEWLALQKAAEAEGIELELFKNGLFQLQLTGKEPSIYYQNQALDSSQYRCIFNGIGTHQKHNADLYILERLHHLGVKVFNLPAQIALTRNKLQSLLLLAKHQIPFTPSLVLRQPEDLNLVKEYGYEYPLIVKRIFGSKGMSVMRVDDLFQLKALFDFAWISDRNDILLIQPFIKAAEKEHHEDVRVITLGKKVVASMMRIAAVGDFRSNFSLNKTVTSVQLTAEEIAYCEQISNIFEVEIAGIDFIRTPSGPVFLEINGNPGFTGINQIYSQEQGHSFYSRFARHMSTV